MPSFKNLIQETDMRILFQGDSITDAGRSRENNNALVAALLEYGAAMQVINKLASLGLSLASEDK